MREFVELCVPEPDSDHVRPLGSRHPDASRAEQAARLTEMWGDAPVEFDPARIAVPTLIVHGADDKLAPVDDSRRLAERIPDAKLIALDGIGHVPTTRLPHTVAAAIDRRFPDLDVLHSDQPAIRHD